MEKKHCCNRFKFYLMAHHESIFSIRIIDLRESMKEFQRPASSDSLAFILTSSYEPPMKLSSKVMNIRFCPFCGTDLHIFYSGNEYINEILLP
jgi:hypothetical protein